MKDYVPVSDHNQVILSNHEPDAIEKKIVETLSGNDIEHTNDEKKYKTTFTWTTTEEQWKFDKTIKVQIKITKVDATTCAIEFMKLSGNQHLFLSDF